MLYTVVFTEGNDRSKVEESASRLNDLHLPVYPCPPLYFVVFSGTSQELSGFLGANRPGGPSVAIIETQGFHLNSTDEDSIAEWIKSHVPTMVRVPDE